MDDCILKPQRYAFSLAASAADDGLPRNIALKPGAAPTDEAAGQTGEGSSSGMTTRRFFTEGKNAPTADTSKDGAAPETAPNDARLEFRLLLRTGDD